jgi:excisionase family DNA binding protein
MKSMQDKTKTPVSRRSGGGEVLLTRTELARKLGVSPRSVDRMTAGKCIRSIRIGNLVRFRLESVLADLEKNNTLNPKAA